MGPSSPCSLRKKLPPAPWPYQPPGSSSSPLEKEEGAHVDMGPFPGLLLGWGAARHGDELEENPPPTLLPTPDIRKETESQLRVESW